MCMCTWVIVSDKLLWWDESSIVTVNMSYNSGKQKIAIKHIPSDDDNAMKLQRHWSFCDDDDDGDFAKVTWKLSNINCCCFLSHTCENQWKADRLLEHYKHSLEIRCLPNKAISISIVGSCKTKTTTWIIHRWTKVTIINSLDSANKFFITLRMESILIKITEMTNDWRQSDKISPTKSFCRSFFFVCIVHLFFARPYCFIEMSPWWETLMPCRICWPLIEKQWREKMKR